MNEDDIIMLRKIANDIFEPEEVRRAAELLCNSVPPGIKKGKIWYDQLFSVIKIIKNYREQIEELSIQATEAASYNSIQQEKVKLARCEESGKVCFPTEEMARRSREKKQDRLRIYRCGYCNLFHLTSRT